MKKTKLCTALAVSLLVWLSACNTLSGAETLGGVGQSETGSVDLSLPNIGQDIQIQLNDKDYSGREIQSAIGCYQKSSSSRANALAKTYIRLLNDAADNSDTLETAYYSVASQIKQEQGSLDLNCL